MTTIFYKNIIPNCQKRGNFLDFSDFSCNYHRLLLMYDFYTSSSLNETTQPQVYINHFFSLDQSA